MCGSKNVVVDGQDASVQTPDDSDTVITGVFNRHDQAPDGQAPNDQTVNGQAPSGQAPDGQTAENPDDKVPDSNGFYQDGTFPYDNPG